MEQLREVEVVLDLKTTTPNLFENIGVAYTSIYLQHTQFVYATQDTETLLLAPRCKHRNVHVSGVANICRHLILSIDEEHPLLGLHSGCLSGTKENSRWTERVEVILPQALSSAESLEDIQRTVKFIEEELATPFVGHNQRKIRNKAIKLGVLPAHGTLSHSDWQALPVIRRYIHGLHLGATDVIMYGMLYVKLWALCYTPADLKCSEYFTLWIDRMVKETDAIDTAFLSFLNENKLRDTILKCKPLISVVPDTAVYNDDAPLGPRTNIPSTVQDKMKSISDNISYEELESVDVNWCSLSTLLRPQRSNADNGNKMCQLGSMLGGVVRCVGELRAGGTQHIRIVDFCSGAGHLGIFIAHMMPECQVILVETKWGSLKFAQQRIEKLGLNNVTICLTHMSQFCGRFEIGMSLHACGSLTDMVLKHCVERSAAVVSSPCCYGKILNSDDLEYPRSKEIHDIIVDHDIDHYFVYSRLADHESNNEVYMKYVDIDRILNLMENGYQYAVISKLKPLTCSPKNNLIIAYK